MRETAGRRRRLTPRPSTVSTASTETRPVSALAKRARTDARPLDRFSLRICGGHRTRGITPRVRVRCPAALSGVRGQLSGSCGEPPAHDTIGTGHLADPAVVTHPAKCAADGLHVGTPRSAAISATVRAPVRSCRRSGGQRDVVGDVRDIADVRPGDRDAGRPSRRGSRAAAAAARCSLSCRTGRPWWSRPRSASSFAYQVSRAAVVPERGAEGPVGVAGSVDVGDQERPEAEFAEGPEEPDGDLGGLGRAVAGEGRR